MFACVKENPTTIAFTRTSMEGVHNHKRKRSITENCWRRDMGAWLVGCFRSSTNQKSNQKGKHKKKRKGGHGSDRSDTGNWIESLCVMNNGRRTEKCVAQTTYYASLTTMWYPLISSLIKNS